MTGWIKKAAVWLMDGLRHFYPVAVCLFGGLMMMAAGAGFGLAGVVIAIVAFGWALDLAATKAAARAKEETAAMFIANLMSGTDTELTVTFRDLPTPSQTERNEG
jgi:hypothetical protein